MPTDYGFYTVDPTPADKSRSVRHLLKLMSEGKIAVNEEGELVNSDEDGTAVVLKDSPALGIGMGTYLSKTDTTTNFYILDTDDGDAYVMDGLEELVLVGTAALTAWLTDHPETNYQVTIIPPPEEPEP